MLEGSSLQQVASPSRASADSAKQKSEGSNLVVRLLVASARQRGSCRGERSASEANAVVSHMPARHTH